jgi:hypothetical protein
MGGSPELQVTGHPKLNYVFLCLYIASQLRF